MYKTAPPKIKGMGFIVQFWGQAELGLECHTGKLKYYTVLQLHSDIDQKIAFGQTRLFCVTLES